MKTLINFIQNVKEAKEAPSINYDTDYYNMKKYFRGELDDYTYNVDKPDLLNMATMMICNQSKYYCQCSVNQTINAIFDCKHMYAGELDENSPITLGQLPSCLIVGVSQTTYPHAFIKDYLKHKKDIVSVFSYDTKSRSFYKITKDGEFNELINDKSERLVDLLDRLNKQHKDNAEVVQYGIYMFGTPKLK